MSGTTASIMTSGVYLLCRADFCMRYHGINQGREYVQSAMSVKSFFGVSMNKRGKRFGCNEPAPPRL